MLDSIPWGWRWPWGGWRRGRRGWRSRRRESRSCFGNDLASCGTPISRRAVDGPVCARRPQHRCVGAMVVHTVVVHKVIGHQNVMDGFIPDGDPRHRVVARGTTGVARTMPRPSQAMHYVLRVEPPSRALIVVQCAPFKVMLLIENVVAHDLRVRLVAQCVHRAPVEKHLRCATNDVAFDPLAAAVAVLADISCPSPAQRYCAVRCVRYFVVAEGGALRNERCQCCAPVKLDRRTSDSAVLNGIVRSPIGCY